MFQHKSILPSSLYILMFVSLLYDSSIGKILMDSFLVVVLEILWAFFTWFVKAPFFQ